MAPSLQPSMGMLEIARPEVRADVRAHPRRNAWGPVDAILALVMLPFAIWMWIIDRLVAGIAALLERRPS